MKSVRVVAVYTIYVDATVVLARYMCVCVCVLAHLLIIAQNKKIKKIKN